MEAEAPAVEECADGAAVFPEEPAAVVVAAAPALLVTGAAVVPELAVEPL